MGRETSVGEKVKEQGLGANSPVEKNPTAATAASTAALP